MGNDLQHTEGVLILGGLFFLKPGLIRAGSPFVDQALGGLYGYVGMN